MNIAQTQYAIGTGSLELYLSGCRHRCTEKCHNKELWDFTIGEEYNQEYFEKLKKKIENNIMIESISILGGEPLDQNPKQFIKLLYDLANFNLPIWLYTSYTKIENEEVKKAIEETVSVIKYGEYNEELKTDDNIQMGIKLASSNQHFVKVN